MTGCNTESSWKHWPYTWYVVARSKQLRAGQVRTGHLAGKQWVLYRNQTGAVYAMGAFCPHMGAHLQSARVIGNGLECGLHACHVIPESVAHTATAKTPGSVSAPAWHCAERFGLIWLHYPVSHPPPLPFDNVENTHYWLNAKPQLIRADWRAMICNGFDLAHMRVVHQREVIGEPQFEHLPDDRGLRMTYQTRVLQHGGISSWLMNKIAGGTIHLLHSCCGSNIMVQSRVGSFQSTAVFSLLPQDNPNTSPEHRQTLAFAAIGLPRNTRFSWPKLQLARWLYISFLKKDFCVLEGMCMKLNHIEDAGVQAVTSYQSTLPDMNTEKAGI